LQLEALENRLVPSSTYLWTGAGASTNWDDPGNWSPAAGATGTYPGSGGSISDVAQFVDSVPGGIVAPTAVVDAAFTVAEVDFGSTSNLILASDGSAAHGLTVTGQVMAASSGSLTIGASLSGAGGLSVQSGTVTLSGANTYTGPTIVSAGSTIDANSGTAFGNGDLNLLSGATLNVLPLVVGTGPLSTNGTLGTGLMGHYYSVSGDGLPDGRMLSTSGILAIIAQYGGGTNANPFGTPIATDTSAFTTANTQGQTNTNNNGATFNYGSGSTGATTTAGFPTVVKTTNGGGNSIFGVWTGIFFAPVAGTYLFDTASDDGTTLFVDGTLIINNNFATGPLTRQGSVNLSAGAHAFEIAYYNGGGGYGLWADVQLPGTSAFQRLPNSLMGTMPPSLLQIGALSGSGTINLGLANGTNNELIVGGDNHSTTFSGTLNAPGSNIANFSNLIKNGSGTLILPTGETYSGQTTVNGGVLQLGTPTTAIAALASSAIVDNGTLTIALPNSTSLTYNGVISGTGGLTIQGQADTITLGGVNTYSGPTNVGGNTLKQGVANALSPASLITLGQASPSLPGAIDLNNLNGSIGSVTSVAPGSTLTNSGASTVSLALNGTGSVINVNVPISGNVNLTVNGSGTEILSAANSYTGGTTVTGSTLKIANAAALPTGTALNVSGTGVLDLAGYSLAVASLSGVGPTSIITDSSPTASTLTINSGVATPQSFSYSGAITGHVSVVNATGASTVTEFTNGQSNTFFGGVTTTSGTLRGLPGAFGTGPITLAGGSADLIGSQQVVGFGNTGVGWTVNLNATAAGIAGEGGFGNFGSVLSPTNTWQATTTNNSEAVDLIDDIPVQPTSGFTAIFTYLFNGGSAGPGNGVTFLLEADPKGPTVLGGTGGALGYGSSGTGSNTNGSIKNSMAIALNLYTGAAGGRGTAIQTDGAINTCVDPGGTIGPLLVSGHPINVVLTYNAAAQVLVETLADTVTGATAFVNFYAVNLFNILGTSSAYLGFSGATGGLNAQQLISNFTYLGASGATTAFTNSIQATPGVTSNLTVQANNLANAYSTSGNLAVPTGATANVGPDATSTANQPYSLAIGGTTTLGGNVNVAGNGSGTGTLILNGPVQGAGTSIGSIGGAGNVVLGAGSTYQLVLGGSTQPGGWTDLSVNGALNLAGGSLSISLANGFVPSFNESFTILQSSGPLTGQFAQGSTVYLGSLVFSITYAGSSVVLTDQTLSQGIPSKLVVKAPLTATAGTPINVTIFEVDGTGATVSDSDTVSLSISAGAGGISPTTVTLINGSATVPITLVEAGSQTITAHDVTIALNDGSSVISVSPGPFDHFKLTLLTTNPAGPGTQAAGNSFLIAVQAVDVDNNAVSSYSGPSSLTLTTSPIDPRSPLFPLVIPIDSSGRGYGLAMLETAGSYTLSVTVGGSTTAGGAVVTVVPAAAARLAFVAQPVSTPTGVKLPAVSVAIQDAYGNTLTSDNTDPVTLSASGPGDFLAGSTVTATAVNGVATFNNLTLVVPGNYALAAIVPGKYTGSNSNGFSIAPLQVTSFSGSATGFTATFNAPFLVNSTTPVLFGQGFGPSAPVPSVTLSGPGGAVEGSVLLNTATNSLTFLETNSASMLNSGTPLLADGTYTAVIHGTAAGDGFQALNPGGGYLGNAHDYTQTFAVNSGTADVVWVPDTADGPLQSLQAPGNNRVGAAAPFVNGYPVYLNDLTGQATSVTLTFNYNPSMLQITGVSPSPSLPGSSFTLNSALSSPGHAVLTYSDSGANAANLTIGNAPSPTAGVPLGLIHATVPNSSSALPIYKGKDLLQLSGVAINGGSIPSVGGDALHLVAFVGDADGNGSYSSTDAVLITRAALQVDAGFTAYPLVDPVVVADTDGSGFIPADAGLEVNEVGVGFPANTVPPPPSPVNVVPVSNNVDPTLRLTSTPTANGGVSVSIEIDDAHPAGSTGLIRGMLALSYDPHQFAVLAADVRAGSLLVGSWTVQPIIDQASGQIVICLSSDTPIAINQAGSLVTIDFQQVTGGIADPSSIALVASETELQDEVGTFALTLTH
jgi:autotransporter-associated beta strand protein